MLFNLPVLDVGQTQDGATTGGLPLREGDSGFGAIALQILQENKKGDAFYHDGERSLLPNALLLLIGVFNP